VLLLRSRLWCIMEIFVFLSMGGNHERIVLLPLGASEAAVLERFEAFDAQQCECFLATDRERLLGVIEAGFGSFSTFNALARKMLLDRVSVLPFSDRPPPQLRRAFSCNFSRSRQKMCGSREVVLAA